MLEGGAGVTMTCGPAPAPGWVPLPGVMRAMVSDAMASKSGSSSVLRLRVVVGGLLVAGTFPEAVGVVEPRPCVVE